MRGSSGIGRSKTSLKERGAYRIEIEIDERPMIVSFYYLEFRGVHVDSQFARCRS